MAERKGNLPTTPEAFDKVAYLVVAAGALMLLIVHFSGALDGIGLFGTIFKLVIVFNVVVLFFFFKSRANKLRGLN